MEASVLFCQRRRLVKVFGLFVAPYGGYFRATLLVVLARAEWVERIIATYMPHQE